MPSNQTIIIGAGPTGIGAARRFEDVNNHDYLLLDQNSQAGGLASTEVTPEGFLFDVGGHVVIFAYLDFFSLFVF